MRLRRGARAGGSPACSRAGAAKPILFELADWHCRAQAPSLNLDKRGGRPYLGLSAHEQSQRVTKPCGLTWLGPQPPADPQSLGVPIGTIRPRSCRPAWRPFLGDRHDLRVRRPGSKVMRPFGGDGRWYILSAAMSGRVTALVRQGECAAESVARAERASEQATAITAPDEHRRGNLFYRDGQRANQPALPYYSGSELNRLPC